MIPGFTAENSFDYRVRRYAMPRARREGRRSVIAPQLPVGGDGSSGKQSCVDKYQGCYLDCAGKYPGVSRENEVKRGWCEDSCDAAYNLCKSFAASVGRLSSVGAETFAQ